MSWQEVLWSVVIVVMTMPAFVFGVEAIASRCRSRGLRGDSAARDDLPRPRVAVLIPAHNERAGITQTLDSLRPQLTPGDRLLVVADNCTDDTATVARAHGAEVAERHDTQRRGKGYALDHGIRQLEADPPHVVVMMDADCIAHPACVDALVRQCAATGHPAQALYLMQAAKPAPLKMRAAELAWRVKNHVRPLGLARLGGPCQLMGTGMAFEWDTIRHAPLASGDLVEDMQLGIDLALAGKPPRFVPEALVTSRFPDTDAAATSQRQRWEHGHLSTLLSAGPRLLWTGLRRGQPEVMALALDLMVAPLALLLMGLMGLSAVNAVAWVLLGWTVPVAITLGALAIVVGGILLAWQGFGRDLLSPAELASAPLYLLRKLPIYIAYMFRRQAQWVRAKRDDE